MAPQSSPEHTALLAAAEDRNLTGTPISIRRRPAATSALAIYSAPSQRLGIRGRVHPHPAAERKAAAVLGWAHGDRAGGSARLAVQLLHQATVGQACRITPARQLPSPTALCTISAGHTQYLAGDNTS